MNYSEQISIGNATAADYRHYSEATVVTGRSPRARTKRANYTLAAARSHRTTKADFEELAKGFLEETAHVSSIHAIMLHPNFIKLVGMGKPALPWIFRRLAANPIQWLPALAAITRQNPADPADQGNVDKTVGAWIRWGKASGYC